VSNVDTTGGQRPRATTSFVPCYIGKSETVGKNSGVLSANLVRLATDTSKFGRWGDNYAYHIGDLSSIVLPGHDAAVQTEKYRSWATALFEDINTDRPRLRQPVFFCIRAWKREDVGIWTEFGPTRLSFLEFLRQQTGPELDRILINDISRQLASYLDQVALYGTGPKRESAAWAHRYSRRAVFGSHRIKIAPTAKREEDRQRKVS